MGVITVTLRVPGVASAAMANVADSNAGLMGMTLVTNTPAPLTDTAVVGTAKLFPVRVTLRIVPGDADAGVTESSVGGGRLGGTGASAKEMALLVPPGVVTFTSRVSRAAAASITRVAFRKEALMTSMEVTLIPVPLTVTVVPDTKFVPEITTLIVLPVVQKEGEIEVSSGAVDDTTENVTALLAPSGVVTLTVRAPAAASAAMVNVAVNDVSLTSTELTVTPVPLTESVVAKGANLRPVSVTATLVP